MKTNQTQSRFGRLRIAGIRPALVGLLCAVSFTSTAATLPASYEPRPGATPEATQPDENFCIFVDEEMPRFQGGGLATFRQWVCSQIVYPAKAKEQNIQGRVVVMFVVEKDGTVSNIKTLLSPDKLLAEEMRRVITSSPKCIPGEVQGKPVRVKYTLSIDFPLAPEDTDWFPVEPVDSPYLLAEVMPKFQGGDLVSFRQWAHSQIVYPAKAKEQNIQGRVFVSFVIEKDGSTSNIEILHSPDELLTAETHRVIASSPKWTPARQHNQLVRIKYVLPVDFKLPAPAAKPTK